MYIHDGSGSADLPPGHYSDIDDRITRRKFLKLCALGLAGLLAPPLKLSDQAALDLKGRVIDDGVKVFDRPSFRSKELKTIWKDNLLPIRSATIGDDEPAHNRVWYEIENEGYTHSGAIQPVSIQLNPVIDQIPQLGNLAEVTVPFTDARWGIEEVFPVAYRFYYATTHWVTDLVYNRFGSPWYRLYDDKWKYYYYAPAQHLRLIPPDELAPISADLPLAAKRIVVNTITQSVTAYEWDRPVFMTRAATGAQFSNGNFATPPGRHITMYKRPFRHMAAGNLAANGYDLPGVPWVTYITESGISFHGTYWHNNYGRPRSHGCINLNSMAAKWIYRWTMPVVPPQEQEVYETYGTVVDVI